jgi:DNA-binding transcriptional regulator YiaG
LTGFFYPACILIPMTWNIDEGHETLDTIAQRRIWVLERSEQVTGELIRAVHDEASRGVTEVELARRAGVTRRTIRNWLGK